MHVFLILITPFEVYPLNTHTSLLKDTELKYRRGDSIETDLFIALFIPIYPLCYRTLLTRRKLVFDGETTYPQARWA